MATLKRPVSEEEKFILLEKKKTAVPVKQKNRTANNRREGSFTKRLFVCK